MPELRKDWLTETWVAFSHERLRRPQQFSSPEETELPPEQDPFAEGNESCTPPEVFAVRQNGSQPNGPGWSVRVVPNRYPALRVEGTLVRQPVGFYDQMTGIGAHEVVIETPRNDLPLEKHSLNQISEVLETYRARVQDLMRDGRLRTIAIFKNSGLMAGASVNHPHSQIIALPLVPPEVEKRMDLVEKHFQEKERSLFSDMLIQERHDGRRVLLENSDFMAVCPYASRHPFEVRIIPKWEACHFHEAKDQSLVQLAEMLKKILGAYRTGLNRPDYNILVQLAPLPDRSDGNWPHMSQAYRWHIELIPRIFGLAGFELSTGCALNAVYPEEATRFLRKTFELSGEEEHESSS